MYDYNPIARSTSYPIFSYRREAVRYPRENGYNFLEEINRNVLRHYVLLALDDRGMLSTRQVTEEDLACAHDKVGLGKSFTITVYGDDLDGRHGGRVFFANEDDVKTLMNYLEDILGPAQMKQFSRSINSLELDPVTKVGVAYYEKWKHSDEEWPLVSAQ